ncbi:MAG: rod shape-determining protein MreD [Patescibacteria group bacterium]
MRLRVLVISLCVIFGLLVQATFLSEMNLFGIGVLPDLVLIVAVSYGLLKGPWYGAVIGVLAGLAADLFAGGVLGPGALAKMATGFTAGLLEKVIFKDNLLVPVLSLFLGTWINEGIFLMVASAFGWHFGPLLDLLLRILAIAACNALLAPLLYRYFYRLEKRLAAAV